MCVKNYCLDEWDKWVLTNFDHDRQWFNTLIPQSHESAAVIVDCISRLCGPVRLSPRYTTADIHCRDKRYEWDCGIRIVWSFFSRFVYIVDLIGRITDQFHYCSQIYRSLAWQTKGCGLTECWTHWTVVLTIWFICYRALLCSICVLRTFVRYSHARQDKKFIKIMLYRALRWHCDKT